MNPRIDEDGTKHWSDEQGYLHREDGPAIMQKNGSLAWYVDGYKYRKDGPSGIHAEGALSWSTHNNLHDEYAIKLNLLTLSDISLFYSVTRLHREDGPALIRSTGLQEWFYLGKRHRIGGPAVIYSNGTCEWWVNGIQVPEPKQTKLKPPIPMEIKRKIEGV